MLRYHQNALKQFFQDCTTIADLNQRLVRLIELVRTLLYYVSLSLKTRMNSFKLFMLPLMLRVCWATVQISILFVSLDRHQAHCFECQRGDLEEKRVNKPFSLKQSG